MFILPIIIGRRHSGILVADDDDDEISKHTKKPKDISNQDFDSMLAASFDSFQWYDEIKQKPTNEKKHASYSLRPMRPNE